MCSKQLLDLQTAKLADTSCGCWNDANCSRSIKLLAQGKSEEINIMFKELLEKKPLMIEDKLKKMNHKRWFTLKGRAFPQTQGNNKLWCNLRLNIYWWGKDKNTKKLGLWVQTCPVPGWWVHTGRAHTFPSCPWGKWWSWSIVAVVVHG